MLFKRYSANPVLLPELSSDWECYNVFNPSVIFHDGLFHMFYRAQGLDWISRLGYAISSDGVNWNRLRQPVLSPHDEWDARGIEDPRVTAIEGSFYMTYTAYGNRFSGEGQPTHAGGGVLPMIACSDNLIEWRNIGPLVRGEDNKDHVLFPRKIGGRYVILHRRPPSIWIAYSDDLIHWHDFGEVMGPRKGSWDGKRVGAGGVPIETEAGWLLFYHGYDEGHTYRMSACILDIDDPAKVLSRPAEYFLQPEELWEIRGDVPNVIFSAANPVRDGKVFLYYGAADHVIGLATAALQDVIKFAMGESM